MWEWVCIPTGGTGFPQRQLEQGRSSATIISEYFVFGFYRRTAGNQSQVSPDPVIPLQGWEVHRVTHSAGQFSWTDMRLPRLQNHIPGQSGTRLRKDRWQPCVLIPVSKFRAETEDVTQDSIRPLPSF